MSEAPNPWTAPWHRTSYEKFLRQDLPELLSGVLTLDGYAVTEIGPTTCTVRVLVALTPSVAVGVTVDYADLPLPDETGVFVVRDFADTPEGAERIVVPTASCEDLSVAVIRCVWDALTDLIARNIAAVSPADVRAAIATNGAAAALRALLPLREWIVGFLESAQRVDATNFLARRTHARRLRVLGPITGFASGQVGRACFMETLEGPNVGRVVSVARGATIRDGRVVIVDDAPAASLGISAGCIPFVAHSETARLLMGANMLRQCHVPPVAEPALVQTGLEPGTDEAPDFWCGRNLLTAFVSWGAATHEDGLVVSQSCAARLAFPPTPRYRRQTGEPAQDQRRRCRHASR